MKFDAVIFLECFSEGSLLDAQAEFPDKEYTDNAMAIGKFNKSLAEISKQWTTDLVIIDSGHNFPKTETDPVVLDIAKECTNYVNYTTADDEDAQVSLICDQFNLPSSANILFVGGCYYSGLSSSRLGMNAWYKEGHQIWVHEDGVRKGGEDIEFTMRKKLASLDGLEMYDDDPDSSVWVAPKTNKFWKFKGKRTI